MNGARRIIVIFLLPLLSSCTYEEMLDKMVPKEESVFAKGYLENLRIKNLVEVKKHLSTELLTPEIDQKLMEVAGYFPQGEPRSMKIIGSNVFTSPGKWQANLTYQYQFKDGCAVANVLLFKESEKLVVKGVHVNRLPQSLEELNAFTLREKSITHYFFLFFAIVIPLFIIYVLVLCIKAPIEKRKWLWIIFVLLGVGGFSINWTTGETFTQLVSVHLLGVGAVAASPYAPWIVKLSIPLGALIFLIKRKKLMKQATSN